MPAPDQMAINLREALKMFFLPSECIEGRSSWTPTYFGSTTAGVTTYTTQTGSRERIGDVILLAGQVVWTNATGTGNARIGTPGDIPPGADSVGVVALDSVTFANSTPVSIIQASGGGLLRMFSPLTNAAPTEVAIEVAGNIRFFIAFFL